MSESTKIFIGSMNPSQGQYGGYKLNMCLSDVPEDRIVTSENGKRYLTFFANELRSPAEDRTHYLCLPAKAFKSSSDSKPPF